MAGCRTREGAVATAGELSGRVALVVGAGRGIGFACAEALADAGAVVAVADVVGPAAEAASSGIGRGATAHAVDVSDAAAVTALVDEVVAVHGRLDVVVDAAGVLAVRPFLELPVEEWDGIFAVNARGAFLVAQAAARQFVRQGGGGRIVLIASIVARTARMDNIAYCASKAAVVQAMRCMALELAPLGITVNAVSPGSTATEMLVDVQAHGDPAVLDGVVRGDASEWRLGIPLGRLADPAEQAAAVVFLAGDGARHITGQELAVDGGQSVV